MGELKKAVAVLSQENTAVEERLTKESERLAKAKEGGRQLQADRKLLKEELEAARKELKAAQEDQQAKLEAPELPPPPEGADEHALQMAALNQELVREAARRRARGRD